LTEDEKIDLIFRETYKNVALNFIEFCKEKWGVKDLVDYRDYADRLINFGLVAYVDNDKARICITEKGERIGKKSSYLDLINEQNNSRQLESQKEEIRHELEKVSLMLAKRQLKTFWLTTIIAVVSLIISIIALLK